MTIHVQGHTYTGTAHDIVSRLAREDHEATSVDEYLALVPKRLYVMYGEYIEETRDCQVFLETLAARGLLTIA